MKQRCLPLYLTILITFYGGCNRNYDPPLSADILYVENFSNSALGWRKIGGPGLLEPLDGVFKHTTVGDSVWCEYVYTPNVFSNARYELEVFVDSQSVRSAFVWRAPDTQIVTAAGGAYQITFNNAGHLNLEKLDPQGRTMLLDVPNGFTGLNRVVIDDRGSSVALSISNISFGSFPVINLTTPQPGYIVLLGADRGGGDYFDNIKISH